MTKKTIISMSLVSSFVCIVFLFSRQIYLCPSFSYSDCAYFFDAFSITLLPTIPLFIFSLITYKMKDQVFQSWWKFARVWILVSMLAILISPSYSYDWMFPLEKGVVTLFFSAIFVVISTILIVYQSFSLRKK